MTPLRINHKQRELIERLFTAVQKQYPEIRLTGYEVNPDDKEHIWIIVEGQMDEEREIEIGRYAAELSTDILMEYGYAISLLTDNLAVREA